MDIEKVSRLQKILTFDTADYPRWAGDEGKCFVENEEEEKITIVGWKSEMGSSTNNYRLVIQKKESKLKNWISLIGFTDTNKNINLKIYDIGMDDILNRILEAAESGCTSVSGLAYSCSNQSDLKSTQHVGRPLTVSGKRVQVYLDDVSIKIAERIGEGNVSQGIRVALAREENLQV